MTITHLKRIELKSFSVPSFAVANDGTEDSIPINQLDDDTLYELVNQLINDIYNRAGKSRPPKATI